MTRNHSTQHSASARHALLALVAVAAMTSTPDLLVAAGWHVLPEKMCGVFVTGDRVTFLLTGDSAPPPVRVLDVDGKQTGSPALNKIAPATYRLVLTGLRTGPYRLVIGKSTSDEKTTTTFALLPAPRHNVPDRAGALACDGAISWLVAGRKGGEPAVGKSLRLARRAGLHMLRDRIRWGEVEPRPGDYQWGRYDAVATASRAAGIDVYQVFHDSPAWSRADHDRKRVPDDLRSAYRFARAAQTHFLGRANYWEPWNEPDIAAFSADPADQLAAHQKATYLGFKAASPKSTVLMVSLAHAPGAFIESFLENETASYFDVYNYHVYAPVAGYPRRAAAHAEVRRRFGVSDKAVWVTEAGIGLKTPTGNLTHAQAVRQAEFLPKAYVASLAHDTTRHFFFILPYYLERGRQFGLLGRGLRPEPGYVALAALTSSLGSAKQPRRLRGLPPGITGWLFARGDGRATAAVWTDNPAPTPISVGSDLIARDLYGRPRAPAADGRLNLDKNVTYLIGKPDAFRLWKPAPSARRAAAPASVPVLRKIVLRFVFSPHQAEKPKEAWRVAPDGALAGKLQIYNFAKTPFAGKLLIDAEPGLDVVPRTLAIKLPAAGLTAHKIQIRWRGAGLTVRKVRAVAVGTAARHNQRSSAAVIRVVQPSP